MTNELFWSDDIGLDTVARGLKGEKGKIPFIYIYINISIKNIINSIYIILIKFSSSLIKNKNNFVIINKLKNKSKTWKVIS